MKGGRADFFKWTKRGARVSRSGTRTRRWWCRSAKRRMAPAKFLWPPLTANHGLGGIVSAQNSAGQTNVLMLGKDQGGTFVVADAQGRPVAEIATVDGEGVVSIKGKGGYLMAYMGCDENRGVIAVLGKEGEQAAALTSNEKGGMLVVFDPKGEPKATLPK